MLDSDIILGIRGYLNCEEYEHGILIQNWENFPLGAPVVYGSGSLLDINEKSIIRILTLITTAQGTHGIESCNVHAEIIAPVNLKPLCKNHKVLTVNQFDAGKFDRLIEFVHDVGGVSFVIEHEEGRKDIVRSLKELEKIFRYTTMFHYEGGSSKHLNGEDDHYLCILTFLDLPYCVPLFNTHKVDGIGLSFSGVLRKASINRGLPERLFRTDIIYSNYMDNVLVVDGINVNTFNPPSSSTYKDLTVAAGRKLKVGPAGGLKKRLDDSGKCEANWELETIQTEDAEVVKSQWTSNFGDIISPLGDGTIEGTTPEAAPDDESDNTLEEIPEPEGEPTTGGSSNNTGQIIFNSSTTYHTTSEWPNISDGEEEEESH